jgi:hypothetical protein
MKTANGGQSRFRASVHGSGPEPRPCKRGCCWSPFGHSTVKDLLPPWHKDACKCHNDDEGEAA